LLGHDLINPENFKQKQGFFLKLFQEKNPKGRFILNPIAEIAKFYVFNKDD